MEKLNKKKIGILTFFDGINHGAYLQCFALFKTIEEMGFDVKIINFKKFSHFLKEYKVFLVKKNPRILLGNIKKIIKFKIEQKFFPTTYFTFCEKNIKEKFDAVVVGSDIVWNYKNDLIGFSSIYFGHNLNTKKLISYAPSFGSISSEEKLPEIVKKGLMKFKHISVRDKNSLDIINNNINANAKIVLDPTLIYNFNNFIKKCDLENFILVYAFIINEKQIAEIKEFATSKGLKIVSISYDNKSWADINIIAVSPFEWLGYFEKAKYIVTSTFHGTLFSIKFNKKFVIIPNDAINNKIATLLSKLNLQERIYSNAKTISEIYSQEIDYFEVNDKLKPMSEDSYNFLKKALYD